MEVASCKEEGKSSESTFKQRLRAEVKKSDALEKRFQDLEKKLTDTTKSRLS